MKNRSKADDWRLVANVIWCVGLALMVNFVLSGREGIQWYVYPIVTVACAFVQYAITKVESLLLSGKIPAPWAKNAETRTSWVWYGLCVILGIDALTNIGGVGVVAKFFIKSDTGDILKSEFGTTDSGLQILKGFMIIALALFVAVAPELLRLYADIVEREDSKFVEVKTVLTPEINNDIINAKKKAQREPSTEPKPTNRFEAPSIRRSNNGTDRTGKGNRKEVNSRNRYRTGE